MTLKFSLYSSFLLFEVPTKMGSTVSSIPEQMASNMKKNQAEAMEAQRRTMMIQAIAMTRERTNWFLAVWSTLVTGLSIAALRGKNVKVGMISVTILGVITAYQWDLGYGDKANRINDYAKEIGQDPKYWFNEAREKQ